jgi:SAM-dependent methyltransferase
MLQDAKMIPSFGYRIGPTARKALKLLRRAGLATTTAVLASVIEDLYIRVYDRRYGVRTSGYIPLAQTSLGQNGAECKRGHRYRAVNAWAFKQVLVALAPSKGLSFVDLGCGLGRACLIAAKYGFRRIKGVDIVPEFCAQARANVEAFCKSSSNCPPVEILLEDAVDYSRRSDDDIIFLYNPFPPDVLGRVIANLIESACQQRRSLLIIYSERVLETSRTLEVLRKQESLQQVFSHSSWGQSFHVFSLSLK